MVIVNFKLREATPVELELTQPELLGDVLERSAKIACLELGGVIAVRNGRVVSHKDLIHQDDVLDVFPALSGG